ncbi:MAG: septum formation family protein, partial [Actinomycetota bacterium]
MRRALAALSAVIVLGAVVSLPVAASADTAPRAAKGDCLSVTDITSVTSAAESVACSQSHNAEIFRIGTAPDSTGLPSQAFVTAQQLNTMCTASEATTALAEALDHLGIKGATIPTRMYLSVLLPTDAQWNAGTRTVQCIVGVTSDNADGLATAQSWTGAAAQKTASEGAGWLLACLAAAPSTGTTLPTQSCTPTSWTLVDGGTSVTGSAASPYPGATLQAAADDVCRPIAESWTAPAKRAGLQFSAVLPPEDAWSAGVHVTSCWIPFSSWDGAVTLTPSTPIPADAKVTVTGTATAFASSTSSYVVRAASA